MNELTQDKNTLILPCPSKICLPLIALYFARVHMASSLGASKPNPSYAALLGGVELIHEKTNSEIA